MALNHLNKLAIPFRQKVPCEIWWKLLKRFQKKEQKKKKTFKDNTILYMHIAEGQGQNIPWVKILIITKKGKRKVQRVPQSQTAALPRPQEEEETDKSKQAQTEQTYEKH